MSIWEGLYIQKYRQLDRLITEQQMSEPNPLFEHADIPKTKMAVRS
jgi:hypothetical protein